MNNSAPRSKRERSRSGAHTVKIADKYLYSPFDPQREARRFAANNHRPGVRTCIIVGDDLHHVADAFLEIDRALRTVVIPVGDGGWIDSDDSWTPGTESVEEWLRRHLRPDDVPGLDLVVLEPARRIAPERCAQLEGAVATTVRLLRSELATVGSFGRRWLRNALHHTLMFEWRALPRRSDVPPFVAAAGPSLEWAPLPDGPIVAVASAAEALAARGVRAALNVHLDGGFWSARYLPGTAGGPLAYSIRAARIRRAPEYAVPLALGWLGEALAPDRSEWIEVGETPTVTLAAIHLARILGPTERVVTVGADFASYGLRAHARPNRTDDYRRSTAKRVAPYASTAFFAVAQTGTIRNTWDDGNPAWQSETLAQYASACAPFPYPSPSGIAAGYGPDGGITPGSHRAFVFDLAPRPPLADRRRHAAAALRTWRDRVAAEPRQRHDETREIAVHLAPTEYISYLGDRSGWQSVARTAASHIDSLIELAERA